MGCDKTNAWKGHVAATSATDVAAPTPKGIGPRPISIVGQARPVAPLVKAAVFLSKPLGATPAIRPLAKAGGSLGIIANAVAAKRPNANPLLDAAKRPKLGITIPGMATGAVKPAPGLGATTAWRPGAAGGVRPNLFGAR